MSLGGVGFVAGFYRSISCTLFWKQSSSPSLLADELDAVPSPLHSHLTTETGWKDELLTCPSSLQLEVPVGRSGPGNTSRNFLGALGAVFIFSVNADSHPVLPPLSWPGPGCLELWWPAAPKGGRPRGHRGTAAATYLYAFFSQIPSKGLTYYYG